MKKLARNKWWKLWSEFWFDSGDLFWLGAFRCLFACTLLVMYLIRLVDFDLFYSEKGMMTAEIAKAYFAEGMQPLIFIFPESTQLLMICYGVLVLLTVMLALGVIGRELTWLVFVLHLMFIQRNYTIVYGADSIATFWLLYLSLCRHNEHFNVLKKRPFKKNSLYPDMFTSMGYRLVQIQLCVVYAYTGLEKIRGDQWWEGSALWYVMGNSQLVPMDLSFMQHVPWLIAVMTFATLMFEIYFPFAVLAPVTRWIWLAVGALMHLGTALFMGLPFFSLVMLSSYFLFLPEEAKTFIFERLGKTQRAKRYA